MSRPGKNESPEAASTPEADAGASAAPLGTAPISLEAALERLDAIVREMETGEIPLEALIAKYEEGIGLSKLCREKLESAEERIRIISHDAAGNPVLEEFDATGEE